MNLHSLEPLIILQNNTPAEDFCGLTPTEMHHLLYNPFGMNSPLTVSSIVDPTFCDGIPFFRLTEELMKIVHENGSLKLTGTGQLPRKVLHALFDLKLFHFKWIDEGFVKIREEKDCWPLHLFHINIRLTGLVKVVRKRMYLTKTGKRMLENGDRISMLRETMCSYIERFNWEENDRYPLAHVGQMGWAYSVYLLHLFGGTERTIEFYSNKYFQAFPQFLEIAHYSADRNLQNDLLHCYTHRVFHSFFEKFGFITIKRTHDFMEDHLDTLVRTKAMEKIFRFE